MKFERGDTLEPQGLAVAYGNYIYNNRLRSIAAVVKPITSLKRSVREQKNYIFHKQARLAEYHEKEFVQPLYEKNLITDSRYGLLKHKRLNKIRRASTFLGQLLINGPYDRVKAILDRAENSDVVLFGAYSNRTALEHRIERFAEYYAHATVQYLLSENIVVPPDNFDRLNPDTLERFLKDQASYITFGLKRDQTVARRNLYGLAEHIRETNNVNVGPIVLSLVKHAYELSTKPRWDLPKQLLDLEIKKARYVFEGLYEKAEEVKQKARDVQHELQSLNSLAAGIEKLLD